MFDNDNEKPFWRKRPPYAIFFLILLLTFVTVFTFQYDTLKRIVKIRMYSTTSEYIIRKEEIKEIANQAVAEIETTKQDSLNSIDNKAKELPIGNASQEVVPQDVLRAMNKARKETR